MLSICVSDSLFCVCVLQHHGIRITDAALVLAAKLADRYIQNRFLPDKVRTQFILSIVSTQIPRRAHTQRHVLLHKNELPFSLTAFVCVCVY